MQTGKRLVREFVGDGSGSLTIEFVLLVPILLAALAFSYEFGRALWAYDVMTRDVRAAVRYISRSPYNATFITNTQNVAMTGFPSGGTAHFPWGAPWSPTASVSVSTASTFSIPTYNADGVVISVTGTVPLTLSLLSFIGLSTSYTLVVTDRARHIGN